MVLNLETSAIQMYGSRRVQARCVHWVTSQAESFMETIYEFGVVLIVDMQHLEPCYLAALLKIKATIGMSYTSQIDIS
jgi:hypothetical protein